MKIYLNTNFHLLQGAPANPPTQQWGQPSGGMWPTQGVGTVTGPKKDGDWSGNAGGGNVGTAGNVGNAVVGAGGNGTANWGDPREMRAGGNPMDLRVDPRELRAPGVADPRAEVGSLI